MGETSRPRGRCAIVPPHILHWLARSDDRHLAAAAREALVDIDEGRLHRRAHAAPDAHGRRKPKLAPGSITGGPVRLISDARSSTDLPGVAVRREGEPATGDVAVSEAYDGLGDTWQLLGDAFERNSIDGRGLPLRASVHYGRDYDNAFWDGTQMVFGDGDGRIFGRFTASLDVIGHELGHGVTEHTAGLMYQGQPGALNESMSDVIGSMVKQRKLGQTAAQADWLIGADLLIGDLAGQALRSMKAPGTAYDHPLIGTDPQPGHMRDYVETDEDQGGVHINSGIPNRAFYLLATALGGPSWEAAGQLWYAVLTGPGISADCDFAGFADLTLAAASTRYGAQSPQTAGVRQAWAEVGVTGDVDAQLPDPPTPGPPEGAGDGGAGAETGRTMVEVSRTGGFAGLTIRRHVAIESLPSRQEQQWRSVLGGKTLQRLDSQARASAEPTVADGYSYGVSCARPPTDVLIPEQHLTDDVRDLLDTTLARRDREPPRRDREPQSDTTTAGETP